jgi:DNA-binding transcriptional ArsR family regulator
MSMANKLIDREEDIQQAAQAIKAIAHPLRLKILCVLGEQYLAASGDFARQGRIGDAQGCEPGVLPHRRFAHAEAGRNDARCVLYDVGVAF